MEELSSRVLCFGGEFGYELLSWLPYLRFVAEELDVPLTTCSRTGSTPFYEFSADHREIEFTWRPDRFGCDESSAAFRKRFGSDAVMPKRPWRGQPHPLSLGGIAWEHQRIHNRLRTNNYRALELGAPRGEFLPRDQPVAIINNKDFENWGNRDPALRENFSPSQLHELRDLLLTLGYFVVYHRFHEPVPEDRIVLEDEGIFEATGCLDMNTVYAEAAAASERTRLQLELYAGADLAICPQGGNSYLPIICGLRTLVLSLNGRLVEYQDLERIYGPRVDVHTSFRSIMDALSCLPAPRP